MTTVEQRLDHIANKIENLAGRCTPVEAAIGNIVGHLMEICQEQEERIKSLEQQVQKQGGGK